MVIYGSCDPVPLVQVNLIHFLDREDNIFLYYVTYVLVFGMSLL